MARDFSVKVRLTESESEYIDKQVANGAAANRSEFMRDLLKESMRKEDKHDR